MKRMTENITDKHHKISTLKYELLSDKNFCLRSIPLNPDVVRPYVAMLKKKMTWWLCVLSPASIPRVAARGQDDSAAGAGAGGVRPRQPRPPVRAAVCPGAEVAAGHLPLQPGPRRPAWAPRAPPPGTGQHCGCWGLLQGRQTGPKCLDI